MPDTPGRVYGYTRMSTRKQEASPEVQREIIERYCQMQGLDPPVIFLDPAQSGKVPIHDRAAGSQLMARLRRGDHVVIAKLDRMFRRLSDAAQVLDQFERMGVKLHVVNLLGGALDLSSPMGRFLIHILAAFAELERNFISERIRDAMAHRKRSYKGRNNNHPPLGFKWEKRWVDGKRTTVAVPCDEERQMMKQIVRWRMAEPPLSYDQIRQKLNFELKIRTKDDTEWTISKIFRAYREELRLQIIEAGVKPKKKEDA